MAPTLEADPGQSAVGVAGALVPHLVHHGAVQVLQEVGGVEAWLLLYTLASNTLGAGSTGGINITTSMTLHHILNKTNTKNCAPVVSASVDSGKYNRK